MKKYALIISKLRKRLRADALKAAEEDNQQELGINQKYLTKLAKRMHSGYFKESHAKNNRSEE